jgi:hypothetical protein
MMPEKWLVIKYFCSLFMKPGKMAKYCFTGQLKVLIDKAENGTAEDIDYIMRRLSNKSSLAETKFADFALGLVTSSDGFEQIKHYLFNGTLIQRNYASLYFNRLGEWKIVKEAYEKGLIDETQAFAR